MSMINFSSFPASCLQQQTFDGYEISSIVTFAENIKDFPEFIEQKYLSYIEYIIYITALCRIQF